MPSIEVVNNKGFNELSKNFKFTKKREYEVNAIPLATISKEAIQFLIRKIAFNLIINPVNGGNPPAFKSAHLKFIPPFLK